MAATMITQKAPLSPFKRWLLEGHVKEMEGPHEREEQHHVHPWHKVMCLTGVDYFSTLGYQPGIAYLAAGALSPIATLILVLLTLLGALPIYRRVAVESHHGEGSISMLAALLSWWKGKFFILCLLGFVATDFIITITLSAADATAHAVENPFLPAFFQDHIIAITLLLVAILSAVFLKGFKEAIGIAVVLVIVYLFLNVVVICTGIYQIALHPEVVSQWKNALFTQHSNLLGMLGVSILLFPKLALGLSGFETGVAVMPLVKGGANDTLEHPAGRIKNTKRLLAVAALIMSVLLISSSFVTTTLIPAKEFAPGGGANGRALAYLAHLYLGNLFGTAYDISTISILWFAGASAMAGLLNIVPRYLPRYGMAPGWTRAMRPLVLVFTVIAFAVTLIFKADVNAQGGAYATGVLVLMSSAAVAVMLSAWRRGKRVWAFAFLIIFLVFAYTTVVNIIERPDGIKIASFFIGLIIIISLVSRLWRSTELRVERVELDETAQRFVDEASRGTIRIIANEPDKSGAVGYAKEVNEKREDNLLPADEPVLFLEVDVCDPSNFMDVLKVKGVEVENYRVLRAESTTIPNSIAALLLYLRDQTGKIPHIYFNWGEGNPAAYLFDYVAFGQGDIAPMTREVLRQAEPNPEKRPAVHVSS